MSDCRVRKERDAERQEQIVVRLDDNVMKIRTRPNRTLDKRAKSFFERDWPAWRTGHV
ncbi:hypothetical protein GR212_25100 [Rhizobium lusitanum]|uniref:Uncharacterized protein n=1 Tax=Rhizobium lusitanum TaxID=293958 RepID=A0A6L9UA73_9HYPH|nr:hypothetical protein [Rhizobium lusitanum]NEI72843.1 hypothetical protein [Rhizobium lusitanum]